MIITIAIGNYYLIKYICLTIAYYIRTYVKAQIIDRYKTWQINKIVW